MDALPDILTEAHLEALDRRVRIILEQIYICVRIKPIQEVIIDDQYFLERGWLLDTLLSDDSGIDGCHIPRLRCIWVDRISQRTDYVECTTWRILISRMFRRIMRIKKSESRLQSRQTTLDISDNGDVTQNIKHRQRFVIQLKSLTKKNVKIEKKTSKIFEVIFTFL